jgi:hypothetical protein
VGFLRSPISVEHDPFRKTASHFSGIMLHAMAGETGHHKTQ